MTGLAYASQHSDAVPGTGSLNVVRYGRYSSRDSWSACAVRALRLTACIT